MKKLKQLVKPHGRRKDLYEKEVKLWIKKLNKPIPQPLQKRNFSGELRIRIPKDLHKKLTLNAKINNVSLNSLIISLLSQKID